MYETRRQAQYDNSRGGRNLAFRCHRGNQAFSLAASASSNICAGNLRTNKSCGRARTAPAGHHQRQHNNNGVSAQARSATGQNYLPRDRASARFWFPFTPRSNRTLSFLPRRAPSSVARCRTPRLLRNTHRPESQSYFSLNNFSSKEASTTAAASGRDLEGPRRKFLLPHVPAANP